MIKVGDEVEFHEDPTEPWETRKTFEALVTHHITSAEVFQVQKDDQIGVVVVRPDGHYWWLFRLGEIDAEPQG